MEKYDLIFVSPHLDDAVLSCGGLLALERSSGKRILVVSVFTQASSPKANKKAVDFMKRCGFDEVEKFYKTRIKEDIQAMEVLGVDYYHLGWEEEDYRGGEEVDLKELVELIKKRVESRGVVYFPVGIGRLKDHLIVSNLGKNLRGELDVRFWEDYPYLMYDIKSKCQILNSFELSEKVDLYGVIDVKSKAINCYQSQLEPLFDHKEMYLARFENYYKYKKTDNKKVHLITKELIGGAKEVNDWLEGFLYKKYGKGLGRYEQIPPKLAGILAVTKKLFWSVENFRKYLVYGVGRGEKILTSCAEVLMAAKIFRKDGEVIYFYQADNGGPYPKGVKQQIYWWIYRIMEQISLGEADIIIVPSDFAREKLIQKFGEKVKEKVKVVSLGIDREIYINKKAEREKGLVVYCGRLDGIKRVDKIIKAVEMVKSARMVIMTPDVNSEYQNLNKEKIKIITPKSKQEIVDYYNLAECVVIASEYESFSLVLLEALACGALVIGSRVGEIGKVLNQVDKNLIMDKAETREIADKIEYVLGMDKKVREQKLAEADKVVAKYSWENTERLFGKILGL